MIPSKFIKMQNLVNWRNSSSKSSNKPASVKSVVKVDEPIKSQEVKTEVPEKVEETTIPDASVPETKPAEEQKNEVKVNEPLAQPAPKFVPGMRKLISDDELIAFSKSETDENNLKMICMEVARRAKRNAKKLNIDLPDDPCTMENIETFIDIMTRVPSTPVEA